MAVFLYASLVEVGILPLSGTADSHLQKQLTSCTSLQIY